MNAYDPLQLIDKDFCRHGRPGELATPNERAVLRTLWQHPGLSRAALVNTLDLTQQSIHRIVEHLVKRRLIQLGAPLPAAGRGQPSPTLTLNPDWGLSAGISINTDRAGVTLLDLKGNSQTQWIDITGLGLRTGLQSVAATLDALLSTRHLDRRRLFGIGFGIAGYRVDGTRYNAPLPLKEWSLIELGPLLADHFGLPVWTENGANTAAVGETMLGVGRRYQNFAYISFNYGFGGGLITGGRLWRGAHGNAGEFSGLFDLAQYDRRPALKTLLDLVSHHDTRIDTIHELQHCFRADWTGVGMWLDMVTPGFCHLLNALSAIVDPEAIVLGGEIPFELAQQLVERAEFRDKPRYGISRRMPELVIGEVRTEASSIGAAALPINACLI